MVWRGRSDPGVPKQHLNHTGKGQPRLAAQIGQGDAIQRNFTARNRRQPHDGAAECGLATAGFADQTEHLPLVQCQRDPNQRLENRRHFKQPMRGIAGIGHRKFAKLKQVHMRPFRFHPAAGMPRAGHPTTQPNRAVPWQAGSANWHSG